MLRVSQLHGFNRNLLRPVTASFIEQASTETDGASFSTTRNLGAADPSRIIVIGGIWRDTGTSTLWTPPTIDGVTPTEIKLEYGLNSAITGVGLWAIRWPTGTSATVVLNADQSTARWGVAIWSIIGKRLGGVTPFATASHQRTDPSTLSLAIPMNGCAIGIAAGNGTSASNTWTGLTADFSVLAGGTSAFTGAVLAGPASAPNSGLTCEVAWGGTPTENALVCASWGP